MLPVSSLISKLSKREKFFFHKHSQGSEDKAFFILYKYFDSTPNATFKNLKSHFEGTVIGNNLSVELNHLQKKILRSLHIFRLNNKSIQNTILKNISFAFILNEKNEVKNALKLIKQTKKIAYKYEEFTLLNQLILLEEEIGYDTVDSTIHDILKKLNLEREKVIKTIKEINTLKRLRNHIIELQYTERNFIINKKKYPEIYESPYLELDDIDTCSRGKDHFYVFKSLSLSLLGQTEKSIKYNKLKYENVRANQHLFTKMEELKSMNIILFHHILLRNKKQFYKQYEVFKQYESESDISHNLYVYLDCYLQLRFEVAIYNIEKLKVMIPYTFDKLRNVQFNTTQGNLLYHYLVGALILTKQFDKAQDVLIRWDKVKKIPYIEYAVKIARLIIYKEINNLTLLKSELQKFKNSLKIKNELSALLIKYFNGYIVGRNPISGNEMYDKLEELSNKVELKKYYIAFYFMSWAKSIK